MKKILLRQIQAEEDAGRAVATAAAAVATTTIDGAPLATISDNVPPKRRRVQGQLPFLTHFVDT